MRPIKFRAWDRENGCWVTPIGNHMVVPWAFPQDNKEHVLFGFTGINWEYGQFTGLKDRNGTEIYEGDAVKYYDSTGMWLTSTIINIGSAFALRTDENPIPLYDFFYTYFYDGEPIIGIEVVGNVHENPELLEKK